MFVGGEFEFPLTPGKPGHEASGEIDAVGSDVTDLAVGDRAAAWRDQPMHVPGCYAQYVALPAASVIRLPKVLSAVETAPLELAMCVGATLVKLRKMNLLQGGRYGVMGLGPAGLVAAQMLRAEGAAQVTGFDLSPDRRQFAASLLDNSFDPQQQNAAEKLDGIIDCVGAKASVEWAMDHAKNFVALFGVQRQDYIFAPRHYMNLCLIGYPGHSLEAAQYALGLVERGALDLKVLSTHHLPLERYNEGIDLLEKQQAVKVCFHPWE
jgi:threonine dehydrogenase-like Zn-dependent dehydrogenase